MGETLRPCPFCGGEAKPDFFQSSYRIACLTPQCPASGGYLFDSEDRAIEAWNRRSQPQEEEPVAWMVEWAPGESYLYTTEKEAWEMADHLARVVPLYRRNPVTQGESQPSSHPEKVQESRIDLPLIIECPPCPNTLSGMHGRWDWDDFLQAYLCASCYQKLFLHSGEQR